MNPNRPDQAGPDSSTLLTPAVSSSTGGGPGLSHELEGIVTKGTDNHAVLSFMFDGNWHTAPEYMETLDHQNLIYRNFAFRSRISDIRKAIKKHGFYESWQIESHKVKGGSVYEYRLSRVIVSEMPVVWEGAQRVIA